jgi:hypothetical protein
MTGKILRVLESVLEALYSPIGALLYDPDAPTQAYRPRKEHVGVWLLAAIALSLGGFLFGWANDLSRGPWLFFLLCRLALVERRIADIKTGSPKPE